MKMSLHLRQSEERLKPKAAEPGRDALPLVSELDPDPVCFPSQEKTRLGHSRDSGPQNVTL